MTNDDTPETILVNLVATLEKHNELFQSHKQALENIHRQVKGLRERVEKLEASNNIDSTDARFIVDINARLKSLQTTIDSKDVNI